MDEPIKLPRTNKEFADRSGRDGPTGMLVTDTFSPHDVGQPLRWVTQTQKTWLAGGALALRADIFCEGQLLCCIAATTPGGEEAQGMQALERRIAEWIADYASRSHSGDTGLSYLA